MTTQGPKPMGAGSARTVEYFIIGMGVLALFLIFQPFNIALFGVGCAMVVVSGLANNLLPLCKPENSWAVLGRTALIILTIFAVVLTFALTSAYLYGVYLQSQ